MKIKIIQDKNINILLYNVWKQFRTLLGNVLNAEILWHDKSKIKYFLLLLKIKTFYHHVFLYIFQENIPLIFVNTINTNIQYIDNLNTVHGFELQSLPRRGNVMTIKLREIHPVYKVNGMTFVKLFYNFREYCVTFSHLKLQLILIFFLYSLRVILGSVLCSTLHFSLLYRFLWDLSEP